MKLINNILLYILICSLIIKLINIVMNNLYFKAIWVNDLLSIGVLLLWIVLLFFIWFLSANYLRYNAFNNIQVRIKFIYYLFFIMFIGVIISTVNLYGHNSGFDPIYQKHILFSTFIGFENDWYGPIKYIVFYLLGEQFSAMEYTVLSIIINDLFIFIGTIFGMNSKQLVGKNIDRV